MPVGPSGASTRLPTTLPLAIDPDSDVPLHGQLVTQLSILIAAGMLPPGYRLPSMRALATRLGIHRNTVLTAYQSLAAFGMVTAQVGSGMRVADGQAVAAPSGWREGLALRQLAGNYVSGAMAAGHDAAAIREAVEAILAPPPINRVVVADPNRDVHPVYLAELAESLSCPIQAVEPTALGSAADATTLVLTSAYHLTAVHTHLPPGVRVMHLAINPGSDVLRAIAALPIQRTVGLVSVSSTLLRMAGELFAGLRRDDLTILPIAAANTAGVATVVKRADLVVVDAPSAGLVMGRATRPTLVFRLMAAESLSALLQLVPLHHLQTPVSAQSSS